MTDAPTSQSKIEDEMNAGADFWRYHIGVNVIPFDTKKRKPLTSWAEWQNKPIPEEIHNKWKQENLFVEGMAVVLGKVWHNEAKKGLFLAGVDCDNRKACDEIRTKDGKMLSMEELAQTFMIEWHRDDPSRIHLYFYTTKPIKGKSSDKNNASISQMLQNNEAPSLEVKGLGEHGIMFAYPSPHKNGLNYEILGTKNPPICDDMEKHIDDVCRRFTSHTLKRVNKETPKQCPLLQT